MNNFSSIKITILCTTLAVAVSLAVVVTAHAQKAPAKPASADNTAQSPQPFGANLFLGNFQRQSADGRNPKYVVMAGDRVAVNTWGSIAIKGVYVVDGQGNIFLPGIGAVRLGGVRNSNLTKTVKASISRVYRRNFNVYTNLLTAAPVAVFVTGSVVRPGRYAGVPSDSVLFFLDQAGGIDSSMGSYRDIIVLRDNKPFAQFDLYDFVLSGIMSKVQFANGDTILVKRRGPVIEVRGETARPALVEFNKEPLTGAGAVRVVPSAARATAVTVTGVRHGASFHQTLSLEEFQTTGLQDGDVIEFRHDKRAGTILVTLEGEFKGPSVLAVHRGSRLMDVLNHVGVDAQLSDIKSIHLRRPSVAAAQKKSINDSLFRLERSALLALSSTDREAGIRAKEAELMQSFIASARLIQPLGRIVTTDNGRVLNVLLSDGDTIVIPALNNVVRVGGEVQMSQAVVYSPKLRARDYVRLAGGYTQRSDRRKFIIHHASAAVSVSGECTSSAWQGWAWCKEVPIRPGDAILVPPKVDSKILQNVADVTQVLYQIAVAAAVVLAL